MIVALDSSNIDGHMKWSGPIKDINMQVRQLFDHETFTFSYLLWSEETAAAVLIDPVSGREDRDLKLLQELGLDLTYVLDTHVHADHVTSAGRLRELTGCKTVSSHLGPECADVKVQEGDTIPLGDDSIEVIETPGHTDDSLCFHVGQALFTGDTLLIRGCGRTDFQNGSAVDLYASITQKLFTLPDLTKVWPGHDYRGMSVSSIGEEKRSNPRLAGQSEDGFRAIMDGLDLPRPKHLDRAVPANRECGLGLAASEVTTVFPDLGFQEAMGFVDSEQALVVDVREAHELRGELGHLDGSKNIPLGEILQASLDWDFDSPILMVCRSGRRSRGACDQLSKRGFRRVANLRGGMLEVRQSTP